VTDPAKADLFDLSYAGCVCNGGFSESGKFRIDGVHEASINVHSGGPEDKQDRDSDGKANDRVGLRESCQDAKCPGDDSEGSEPVCSRVQTVGNKSRRADLPADADPVDGDQFVADESDEAGGSDDPRIADWSRPSCRSGSGCRTRLMTVTRSSTQRASTRLLADGQSILAAHVLAELHWRLQAWRAVTCRHWPPHRTSIRA
jgi:hypothetical protein